MIEPTTTPGHADETDAAPAGSTAAAPPAVSTPPTLWHNRPYMLLMTGKTVEVVGSGMATFAVPLLALALSGSLVVAGTIGAVAQVGALVATLPAGVVADRWDRRTIVVGCSILGLAAWGSLGVASLLGGITTLHLAIAAFLAAVARAVYEPAESAAIRHVVPTPQLGSAMAAVQGRSAVASLVASPLGGLLYAVSRVLPALAGAVGHLVALVCALGVRVRLGEPVKHKSEREPARRELVEGWRYVMSIPFLRASLGVFALINLTFNGLFAGLNLHLADLHTAPFRIGLIDGVSGAAMLVGSLAAGRLVARFPAGRLAVALLFVVVIGAFVIPVTGTYAGYLVGMGLAGLAVPAVNAGLIGYAAAITPGNLQGRMNSVLMLCTAGLTPLAPFLAGVLLSVSGPTWTFGIFAAGLAASWGIAASVRSLRRIGTPDTWADDAVVWPPPGEPVRG
ncbi:MFS transporter [Luteimicrobium xylanilyticum]|uniref:Macrolide efflux protein n=1 Tax=Luteimicrobium xylanilyticum TaxID=1133546 RepID=A0A5P9Q6Q3_9MICO|nr:MFS transporter [Luteimicrobium xylanilyticum]QFU96790.1 Macrolide efflux protein [Luteimicrobium xylanilyticum]